MKIIQAYEGLLEPDCKCCLDNIKNNRPKNIGYELLDKFPKSIDRTKGLRNTSDIFRMEYLIESPNDIWLDWDIKIDENGWFPFIDNGKPYFANVFGMPDIWIIAPMGNKEFLKELYMEAKKVKQYNIFGQVICKILNTKRNEINFIHNGYFNHMNISKR